ncbi:hypothetical protein EYF80_036333 [Liparis tanakae]|uniref:Uncharacterized protein n=1 Tax=Liparis tanakae TaxID=230148 RepID=A0A4Z2GKQ6_9TELE|nr:hypothetical protein EYF80_036333 [Liparis tanakae]
MTSTETATFLKRALILAGAAVEVEVEQVIGGSISGQRLCTLRLRLGECHFSLDSTAPPSPPPPGTKAPVERFLWTFRPIKTAGLGNNSLSSADTRP